MMKNIRKGDRYIAVCHTMAHAIYTLSIQKKYELSLEIILVEQNIISSIEEALGSILEISRIRLIPFSEKSFGSNVFIEWLDHVIAQDGAKNVILYIDAFESGKYFLRRHFGVVLAYEGLATYSESRYIFRNTVLRWLRGHPAKWGWSYKIKVILVPEMEKMPTFLQKKSVEISQNQLISITSEINAKFLKTDPQIDYKWLYVTQPFVEEGIINCEQYQKFLHWIYNEYSMLSVLIKRHPRDLYDYSNISEKYGGEIIKSTVAIELMIREIKQLYPLITIISVDSSSIQQFKENFKVIEIPRKKMLEVTAKQYF